MCLYWLCYFHMKKKRFCEKTKETHHNTIRVSHLNMEQVLTRQNPDIFVLALNEAVSNEQSHVSYKINLLGDIKKIWQTYHYVSYIHI